MIINLIKKRYFLILFIILVLIAYVIIHANNKRVSHEFLSKTTESIALEYRFIYKKYKDMADLIFKTDVNKPEIIALFKNRQRTKLYDILLADYKELETFSVRQLHFHLPNNDSFLRMHRPLKFGDNLSKARLTIKYVNENLKSIDGFEEGKIFNGFRFVYPLFNEKKHIGSVEVSFSALAFIKDIVNYYDVKSNFHIAKSVVDKKVFKDEHSNYIQSPLSGYYCQKSIVEFIGIDLSKQIKLQKKIEDTYEEIQKGMPFSKYFEESQEIITFIPILNNLTNKVVAVFTFRSEDYLITKKNINSKIMFLISILIIGVILVLIYKELKYKNHLEHKIEERTKELYDEKNKLYYQAHHDPLTGVRNRLSMNGDIENVIKNYAIHKAPYAVLMFDIDWFKEINDTYGHDIGDMVLVELAKLLQDSIREEDKVYRAGGEEFVILLKRITYNDTINLAEKIRLLIQNNVFKSADKAFSRTISCGLYHSSMLEAYNVESVLKLIDNALYESKNSGRNKITLASTMKS